MIAIIATFALTVSILMCGGIIWAASRSVRDARAQ